MNNKTFSTTLDLARVSGWLLMACAAMTMSSIAWAGDTEGSEYVVAIGDTLSVNVFGHEDLSGECEVDRAGRCSLPLIKYVDAAGLSVSEFEATVANRLRPDYLKNPQVQVEIVGYRPIYVLGEVKNPGSYPYSAGMTVVNAVALAGGYTYRAARGKITIVRSGGSEESKERIGEQDTIRPGDVIEIPERFF